MYDLSGHPVTKTRNERRLSRGCCIHRPMYTGAHYAIVTIFIYRVIWPTLAIIIHLVAYYSMLSYTI